MSHIPSLTEEELVKLKKLASKHDGETQMTVDKGDVRAMVDEIEGARGIRDPKEVAAFIYDWFETRNGGEFSDAIRNQRVSDRRLALVELEAIVVHRGRPPYWTTK